MQDIHGSKPVTWGMHGDLVAFRLQLLVLAGIPQHWRPVSWGDVYRCFLRRAPRY